MPTDLEQSIFRTVAFFSLFDYPLTEFEIWKWLTEPAVAYAFPDVRDCLSASHYLREKIVCTDGFFTLRDTAETVALRHERFVDAARKYHRLQRVCGYLAHLPMIRAVAACNTLAWNNTKAESDIDLFVIVKHGRIWITRFLAVLPFKLLGLRPGQSTRDPICFSFFAADDRLAMKGLKIGKRDLYFAQWMHSLVPVMDRGVFRRVALQNGWVNRSFPNSFPVQTARPRTTRPTAHRGDAAHLFESLAKGFQVRRLPPTIRSMMNNDTRVIIDDGMLKFHEGDRREEFMERLAKLV